MNRDMEMDMDMNMEMDMDMDMVTAIDVHGVTTVMTIRIK